MWRVTGPLPPMFVALLLAATPVRAQVVISQVFGAGGNQGAAYRNDFVELFNRGTAAVSLSGWSIQYSNATQSIWNATPLSGTLQPGAYYLVQQASGGSAGVELPPADAVGTVQLSSTTGKVALLNTTTVIANGTSCPSANVVDLLGYGSATTCFEGSGAGPTLATAMAAMRLDSGCTDTNNNAADFVAVAPTPRNSSTPVHPCSGGGTCQGIRGDLDHNGVVDGPDIQSFVACLMTPGPPAGACVCADMDQNNVLNAADVAAFTAALTQ